MNSAIALVLPALVVVAQAQPERIAMPRGPAPDQTVRVRMTQDMTMTFDPGDAPGAPMPAMTMVMKMIIAQTMKVGPLDDRRRYQAAITIDDATAEMTLNGAAMPMPGGLPLAHGQQFTIQYDEDRAIAGITGDAPASATEMFKKMFETVGRSIPGTPMAVGDTVAVPIALPLPSMPSGPSGDMTGEASMTLKAITSDSSARSATFDSKFTARMASPAGAAPVMFDIRFDGGGTMVFDLDRGVATMTDQQGTVDGSMSMGSAMPQMKVRGTIKSSSQSTY